jgi:hypothetical protein
VSVSQLNSYEECSYKYKRVRILQDLPRDPDTIYTRLGGICHEAIEQCIESLVSGDGRFATPYDALVGEGGVWDTWLAKAKLTSLKPRLEEYAHHTTKLYYRASASYQGADAIRNKGDFGGDEVWRNPVSKAPHMTGTWKAEAKKLGLDAKASFIDKTAAAAEKSTWGAISLSQTYAETAGILWPYQHPQAVASVIAIELGISDTLVMIADENGNQLLDESGAPVIGSKRNDKRRKVKGPDGKEVFAGMTHPFPLPKLDANGKLIPTDAVDPNTGLPLVYERRDDVYFNGYIDLLGRDEEGRLLIVDHKSSLGESPAPLKVSRHEQLLVYGLLVAVLFGEMPAFIGINHLRSGKLVLAPFDMAKAELAMERFLSIVSAIDAGVFIKQHPDAYVTACVKKGRKEGEVILCSGLKGCHPEVYEYFRKAGLVSAA